MATNIFKLIGEVSVNMGSFNTAMDTALGKVNSLATALNNLNGTSATVTVNQTGTGVPTVTSGSASSGSTTSGSTQSGTGTSGDADNDGMMVVAPGSDGWTIGKGVVSQWLAKAGEWAFDKVVDQLGAGWDRNKNEAIFAERIGMFTGLDGSEAWQFVEKINQFAYDTPLNVEDAWNVATQLLNYGVLQEDLIDTLWMLGDMTLGDNTKMTNLAKAYTDLLGKGMLYAEEGRQFTNIIPLWDMLETYYASDGYNGPYKGYDSLTIKGGLNKSVFVTAEDVTAAFKMATAEGGSYYNAMARIMGTQFGQEQLIGENMTNIAANLTAPFQDIVTKLINPAIIGITGWTMDATKGIGNISLDGNGTLMSQFIDAFGGDGRYAIQPFRGLYDGIRDIPENASTFFSDWYNLLTFKWFPGDYLLDNNDNPGGGRRFEVDDSRYELRNGDNVDRKSAIPELWNPMGGPGDAKTITFDDNRHFLPGAAGASSVFTQFNDMPNQITAAVREGFTGATVTVNVTTGDVRLSEGTLVGSLAPRVDAILGAMNARAARG